MTEDWEPTHAPSRMATLLATAFGILLHWIVLGVQGLDLQTRLTMTVLLLCMVGGLIVGELGFIRQEAKT